MNRIAIVTALAPVAPACFPSRSAWLEYLTAAVTDSRDEHAQSPLIVRSNGSASFNWSFSFCGSCTERYSHEQYVQGRCQPEHLLLLAPPRPSQPNPMAAEGIADADLGAVGLDDESTDFGALA